MSDPTGEKNIDQSTGTALPTAYAERLGDRRPSVLRLNIEEQRDELARTMSAIRRRIDGRVVLIVAGSIVLVAGTAALIAKVRRARSVPKKEDPRHGDIS